MTAVTGATTATSWASAIADERIIPDIFDYMHEAVSVTPAATFFDLRGQNSAVAAVNRHVNDFASVAAISEADPSTGIVATESTLATKVSITCAKYGIKRAPSVELLALQGDQAVRDYAARDAGTLLALYLENALIAQFGNATPAVNHTGQPAHVLYHLELRATLRNLNAPGPYFACWDNVAWADIEESLVSAGGAILGNSNLNLTSLLDGGVRGAPQRFFGVNTVDSTLCATSSSDAVSGMVVDTRVSAQHAGLGYAMLIAPSVWALDDPDTLTAKMTFFQSTGTGIPNVNGIAKALTIAT